MSIELENLKEYPVVFKEHCLSQIATGLSLSQISKDNGVNRAILATWVASAHGRDYLTSLKQQENLSLDGQFTGAIDMATKALFDRLEFGDIILLKGKLVRTPVTAKDVAFILSVLFDKRQVLRNTPQSVALEDSMAELTNKLRELGKRLDKSDPIKETSPVTYLESAEIELASLPDRIQAKYRTPLKLWKARSMIVNKTGPKPCTNFSIVEGIKY